MTEATAKAALQVSDALLVVDMQNDFLPGGALAVPGGDEVIPVLNRYIALFEQQELPVFASRDWHTPDHCSFKPQGGAWPPHCVANSPGAEFARGLDLPATAVGVLKGARQDRDAYSAFEGTNLCQLLQRVGVKRLFIGGLTTDYCVLNTVRDALKLGFEVFLLRDATRAVNVQPGDGERAEVEMLRLGAKSAGPGDITV